MLTEIEWWGGVLFLWWALCVWFLLIATKWVKYGFQYGYSAGALLFTAIVLALFFYPLDAQWAKFLYVGVTALAAVCVGLVGFYPEHDDAIESPDSMLEITIDDIDRTIVDTVEPNSTDSDDPDEEAKYELIGNLILLTPLGIILLLGIFKCWQLFQSV
ncbi:hypothetical protein [Arenicella xantha]|uniref:Uncharacterized protein n=1 Tax=Arenicella xantha TaxID=644221 RepID=A0A395JQ48_9GAMM|nr:hypothetical protein [Arenicella xantha]RBP51698.1 hypothetical protein DFR28_1021131 [Arenicella xantha]